MILSQYLKDLHQRARKLPEGDVGLGEICNHLQLKHFQIQDLVNESLLVEHKNSKGKKVIAAHSVAELKEKGSHVFKKLTLSSLEIREILDLPSEKVGDMITKGTLRSYRKRKRAGFLRSLFRFGQLLSNERAIQKEVEKYKRHSEEQRRDMIEKYQHLEDDLAHRSSETAERLVADDPFAASKDPRDSGTKKELKLDSWQEEAILSLERQEHVFVQAPTGAGKTAVVEHFLLRNLASGVTLFYAVPIKALANDKFFDFCELYGQENIGINTGDITLNPDAPIVIGTTEIVRNILLDRPDAYKVIAYDEAQYLGDPERGGAWEESIIMCDDETLLVFLSGSVANGDVVANWIDKIKGRSVNLFTESVRPVPLQFAFPFKGGFLADGDWEDLRSLAKKTQRSYYEDTRHFFRALEKAKMTPVLLFMARRRDCEEIFKNVDDIDSETSRLLSEELKKYPELSLLNLRLRQLIEVKGVAYHHSGLLPPEKKIVESLAKKGLLKLVSATMSLASGVNFSVRSCFISEYQRPGNGGNMQPLAPSEILQMWGRAGRRGLDTEGYVIPCMDVQNTVDFDKVEAFPEAIVRDNFVSPINLLSILSRYNVEQLEDLCQKSFSSFVEGKAYRVFSDPTMKELAGSVCESPTYELPPYRQGIYAKMKPSQLNDKFRCGECANVSRCMKTYDDQIKYNPLQKMVKHLKMNGYISNDFSLTFKGSLAERFHSDMGLLVAHDIERGRVRPDNLVEYAASVSASGHIDFIGGQQRAHLDLARKIYPQWLFPNLWERQRGRPVFINWNPGAGTVVRQWVNAEDWEDFAEPFKERNIQGDVFRAILRTGELLRSMAYLKDLKPEISEAAMVAAKLVMRPPLIPEELFVLS